MDNRKIEETWIVTDADVQCKQDMCCNLTRQLAYALNLEKLLELWDLCKVLKFKTDTFCL